MSKYRMPHKSKVPAARPAWMVPAIITVVVVVVIGVALVLTSRRSQPSVAVTVAGKPNVIVDKTEIDFGDVQFGKPVTAVFNISNTGDQPLQIVRQPYLEIIQGCCPPQAVTSTSTINPGETATVSVNFTMHEGMGGQHEFLVHLLTNDPAQAETQLRIFSNWIA